MIDGNQKPKMIQHRIRENSIVFAALDRATAKNPKDKAWAEYAWKVSVGILDPNSVEGEVAFETCQKFESQQILEELSSK